MKVEELNSSVLIWGSLSAEGLQYLRGVTAKGNWRIVVPENRPSMIGLNHNIPLIKERGLSCVYCTDNMLGFLFYKRKINQVVISYNRMSDKEIVAGCGSLFVLCLARLHAVRVKFILQGDFDPSGFDKDASSLGGKSFVLSQDAAFIQPALDEVINKDCQGVDIL